MTSTPSPPPHESRHQGWPRIDRRAVLAGSAAVSLAAAGPAMAWISGTRAQAVRFAVFDSRLAPSTAFARTLATRGAEPLDVAGGLTRLWQDRLVPHWRSGRGAVAGLTTRSVWYGISQQAILQFRRPANLALHHLDDDDGPLLHRLGAGLGAAPPDVTDPAWPDRMALLAEACAARPANLSAMAPIGIFSPSAAAGVQLATWMIG